MLKIITPEMINNPNLLINYKFMENFHTSSSNNKEWMNSLFSQAARILFLCFITLFTTSAFAGSVPDSDPVISLSRNNIQLKELIVEIEDQIDYLFIASKEVDLNYAVSIDCKDQPISKVLSTILKDSNISYTISGVNIILSNKKQDVSAVVVAKDVKKHSVSGVVTDENSLPLPGVIVSIPGTTTGTATGGNGDYAMNVAIGGTLQFSYMGYKVQTIVIGANTVANVQLEVDGLALEEVVIVGFGVQKKVNLTGAVTSVNMDDALGDRPISNLSNALQSVVPGLKVSMNEGTPGGSPDFNIRGTTSINGGAPLVLVNNVPMSMDMIDPQDVESISVLKDAASAAIYGARAAFGVILITTKQGKKGSAPVFNYNNNFSFSSPLELPQKASPMESVKAYQQMDFTNGNYVDGSNLDKWESYLDKYADDPSQYPSGYTYDEDGKIYLLSEQDFLEDMMQNYGFMQNHSLSVSGGSDKSTYRLGISYTGEDGVLITDKDSYDRINITSFIGVDLNKWLTAQLDLKYANANKSIVENGGRGGIWNSGLAPSFLSLEDQVIDGILYPMESPATYIEMGEPRTISTHNIRALGRFIVKPAKNLKIVGEYTFDRRSTDDKLYTNKYLYVGKNLEQIRENVSNSEYEIKQGYTNYNAVNIFANYTLELGKHNLDFMGGYNQEFSHTESQFSSKSDVFISNLPSLGTSSGTAITTDAFNEYAIRGLFYRMSYNYAGTYFLEANGRYDGSSRFPQENRFGFFPSFSGAYRISEEKFMESTKEYISNLKLRASWGTIGNQVVGSNYPYIATMSPKLSNWLVDGVKVTTLGRPKMVSSTFSWEQVQTLNFALDLDMFNNRLSSTVEWYRRDTKDMLAPGMELPGVVGADAALQNAADLRTTGWEFSLNWRDQVGKLNYREIGRASCRERVLRLV